MKREKGCGKLTIPYGYCDGKDYLCSECSKKMKKEKTLSEEIEYLNEISPDFIGDNSETMKEGTITPIGYIKAEKVKQKFKEILDEIEEERNNVDNWILTIKSSDLRIEGVLIEYHNYLARLINKIKQKSGFDLK